MLVSLVSSAKTASVALYRDGAVLGEALSDDQKRHSVTLLPLLDALLEQHGIALDQVDVFAVDVGPGSFTGVRIGTSSINALAAALHKQVIGINALDILYEMAGRPEDALILIDAGGGRAYGEHYRSGVLAEKPRMDARDAFLLDQTGNMVLIEGMEPKASALCTAAVTRMDEAADAAYPVYLAPSQAERLYRERHPEGNA